MNTECLQQPAIEEREPEEDPKPYFSPNWANRQTLTLGAIRLAILKAILLCSAGDAAQGYVAAWMGGEFGGEWVHVCVAESLCCPPETITAL